jgi:hypothetical protein
MNFISNLILILLIFFPITNWFLFLNFIPSIWFNFLCRIWSISFFNCVPSHLV